MSKIDEAKEPSSRQEVSSRKGEDRLKEIIDLAIKLKWTISRSFGYPLMQLSEVEKCMLAMIDDSELERMRDWVKNEGNP